LAAAGAHRLLGHPSREAEIGQIAVAAPVDEHVRRLDVAMDEPALVSGVERVGDLLNQPESASCLEHPFLDQHPLQVGAFDQAHRDVELTCDLAGFVDRDDRGMIERRGQPRLAQEALPETNVLGQLGCEDFYRDVPVKCEVVGAVDNAHPPATEQRLDPIARKLAPGHELAPSRRRAVPPAGRIAPCHAPPSAPNIRSFSAADQIRAELNGRRYRRVNRSCSCDQTRGRFSAVAVQFVSMPSPSRSGDIQTCFCLCDRPRKRCGKPNLQGFCA